jgi:hypothetical protein
VQALLEEAFFTAQDQNKDGITEKLKEKFNKDKIYY